MVGSTPTALLLLTARSVDTGGFVLAAAAFEVVCFVLVDVEAVVDVVVVVSTSGEDPSLQPVPLQPSAQLALQKS